MDLDLWFTIEIVIAVTPQYDSHFGIISYIYTLKTCIYNEKNDEANSLMAVKLFLELFI